MDRPILATITRTYNLVRRGRRNGKTLAALALLLCRCQILGVDSEALFALPCYN